jgi:uncharacterized protein (TIGR03066 family)
MRGLIGAAVVVALAGFTSAAAQEKIDGNKLVGRWEPTLLPGSLVVLEFTAKGTVTLTVDKGGKTSKAEGTYKLDGNTLDLALKLDGKEQKETITISKLTDDEWVGKDAKGKEESFRKMNPKK